MAGIRPPLLEVPGRHATRRAQGGIVHEDVAALVVEAHDDDVVVAVAGDLPRDDERPALRDEVAELLRVNERTVRRWTVQKGLPCIHLGTRLRFSQRNVLRWVSAREEGK